VGAFGGQLFGPNGEFVLSPTALTSWLAWLQESGHRFGVRTTPARSEARQLFLAGASTYYVATSTEYADLADQMGEEALAVALMPLGPGGPGRPLAVVDGLMASAGLAEDQAALAARFLNYAASASAQTRLLDAYQVLPANSTVRLERYPDVTRIAVQVQSSSLLQDTPWLSTVVELGDIAYRQVLQEGVAPADAVDEMYEALAAEAERSGFTMPTPGPAPSATPAIAPPAAPPTPESETGVTPSPPAAGGDAP
jgi:ABC-type glycerol-3-phosphate transport system substrate-binding protein